MNGYERFMTALKRKGEPDRIPLWELIVNEPTFSASGAVTLEDLWDRPGQDGVTIFEDMHSVPLSQPERAELARQGHHVPEATQMYRDEWGVTWGHTGLGIPYPVAGPIRSLADLKHYRAPNPEDPHRLATLRRAVKHLQGRKAVVFLTHDGFEFPYYLRGGMERLLIDYLENPELARTLADITLDYKIRLMVKAIQAGADAVVSGDDYANRGGLIMSPKMFREFILPGLKRSVDAAHTAGVPFIKHTDGDIWTILDDLIEAGVDALDPLEPVAHMDIGRVKAKYGGRLTVIGNIDCSHLLPGARVEEVEEAVKETIAKAAPGGGYILASSNSIHPGVKPENFFAMERAAREFGRYPIDPDLVKAYQHRNYIARYLGG